MVGNKFVFDETRSRFVYPQDKSLTVYFEWETAAGPHTLSAAWKQPDGKIASISPDVKIVTQDTALHCYWIFNLVAGLQNGPWTVEVRVDGQPAGSHFFEIAGMVESQPEPAPAPSEPKFPTLDDIYKSASPSLVWIHKLDQTGHLADTASGFVLRKNLIATAFQAIDSAHLLEVEFANGRKENVADLAGWSRVGDWALLRADTGSIPPIERGDPAKIVIGERQIVFNVESNGRTIGGVDIGGRRTVPGLGERIQIAPDLGDDAAGGPLLDLRGHVVGVIGGSLNPGARVSSTLLMGNYAIWRTLHTVNGAIPITAIPDDVSGPGKSLAELAEDGTLTAPLDPVHELQYAGTSNELPKNASDRTPRDVTTFSLRDPTIFVYSMWVKKSKLSKGEVGARVYDPLNRLRVTAETKRISLSDNPVRIAFSFSPAALLPGMHRIDLLWNGQVVWRAFIQVQD